MLLLVVIAVVILGLATCVYLTVEQVEDLRKALTWRERHLNSRDELISELSEERDRKARVLRSARIVLHRLNRKGWEWKLLAEQRRVELNAMHDRELGHRADIHSLEAEVEARLAQITELQTQACMQELGRAMRNGAFWHAEPKPERNLLICEKQQ